MSVIDLRVAGFARAPQPGAVPDATPAGRGIDPGAAAQVGRAVEGFGSALMQFAQAERAAVDADAAGRASARLTERLGELQVNFAGRDLRDSSEAARLWQTEAGEIARQVGEEAGLSRRALREWTGRSAQLVAARGEGVRLQAFERGQQERLAALSSDLEVFANAAAASNNPADLAAARTQADERIQLMETTGVITPVAARQARDRFETQVSTARVVRAMASNPGEALRLLSDPTLTPGIDADRRANLMLTAQNAATAAAARADAQLARQERAAMVELRGIEDMLARGFIPEERLARVRTLARGTPLEATVATLETQAREVAGFARLPVAQQAARLAEIEARLRGGTGTPEDMAQYGRLAGIVQAQQRDIGQDGLSRAAADGIVQPLPPLNLADPASLSARVEASQAASAHYGRPVSFLTRQDAEQVRTVFERGSVDDVLTVIGTFAAVEDGTARREGFRHLETIRGDAGRLPPGSVARLADLMRDGSPQALQAARQLLGELRVDVSDRARQIGESTIMNTALASAQTAGVQAVRGRQAQITGDAAYTAVVARDMEVLRRAAASRATAGADVSSAVSQAQAQWNAGLAVVDRPGLAAVYFPARDMQPREAEAGLRALRQRAIDGVPIEAGAGADVAAAARARRAAIGRAEWVNAGDAFVLFAVGEGGRPEPVMRVTMDQVRAAARPNTAAVPAPIRAERALQDTARERRAGEAPQLQ